LRQPFRAKKSLGRRADEVFNGLQKVWAMVEQAENVVLEILRQIESDLADILADIKDVKAMSIDIRTQLATMLRRGKDQRNDLT
jgi:hypothetical protein